MPVKLDLEEMCRTMAPVRITVQLACQPNMSSIRAQVLELLRQALAQGRRGASAGAGCRCR